MVHRSPYRQEEGISSHGGSPLSSVSAAAGELEALRRFPSHDGVQFPPHCRNLLLSLPGNTHCADCGCPRPEWASVSYGIMLCTPCGGRHRGYGVQHSRVKSIDMDAWNHRQVLAMLEGGNGQLGQFFERHLMEGNGMTCKRYKTKAALFYRTNLQKHVDEVAESGVYQGREAARRSASRSRSPSTTSRDSAQPTVSGKEQQSQAEAQTISRSLDIGAIQQQGITAS